MNTQVNVILPVDLGQKIKDLAWTERKSTSGLCRELLTQAIKIREGEGKDRPEVQGGAVARA